MKGLARLRRVFAAALAWAACVATVSAWEYGMMIDAGSGGSRLHFYRWPVRTADPLQPLYGAISMPEELFQVSTRPGISAFAHNVSGIVPYMENLLGMARARLTGLRQSWYLIPVYLKATAGARNLYQDQRDEIFSRIRDVMAGSEFRFDSKYWARTISGEEEGVAAWLTVNAIKGTYRAGAAEEQWGTLDMGGASTQIAFIPKDISIIQNYYPLHLSYIHLHMYTHSFLEFGYRDANHRVIRRLMKFGHGNGTEKSPVMNPCYRQGFVFEQAFTDTFSVGRRSRWVQGTGDLAACIKVATALLKTNARCYVPATNRDFAEDSRNGACSINGIYEPLVDQRKFVAIGQYAKQAKLLGVQLDVLVPLSEWMAKVEKHCDGKDWKDFCWTSIWLGVVLTAGLRFPLHTKQVMFSQTLDGKGTGWALGAMMNEVNAYPWHTTVSPFVLEAPEPARGAAVLATSALVGPLSVGVGIGIGWVAAIGWAAKRSGFREPLLSA